MTDQPSPQQPAGQPPAQPPYGQPGSPLGTPPKKSWFARHKVLTVIGAVVAVIIVGVAATGGGDDDTADDRATSQTSAGAGTDDTTTQEPAAEEPKQPSGPGIGEEAADGEFTFVVTQVEPGVTRIGNEYLSQEPQGQYVLVHVTVTNTGTEARYFDSSSQKAQDTEGRTHSADSSAGIYLDDSNSFLNQINPGNQVAGVVVFDIPVNATLATVDLHDSAFSGGVTVRLT